MNGRGFSPGPWRIVEPELDNIGGVLRFAGIEGPQHLDGRGQPCCHVAKEVSTLPNAHLIAAAPDLYEAAKPLADLINYLEAQSTRDSGSVIGDQYRMRDVTALDLRRLRDAVLKAEGREVED